MAENISGVFNNAIKSPNNYSIERGQAEARFPYLENYRHVGIAPAIVKNKGGMGEFEEAGNLNNPLPNGPTITIGPASKGLSGGVSDTIISDMVHAAGVDPKFSRMKRDLISGITPGGMEHFKNQFANEYQGKQSGSNFADIGSFMHNFIADGYVQKLLAPQGDDELFHVRQSSPVFSNALDEIEAYFKVGPPDNIEALREKR